MICYKIGNMFDSDANVFVHQVNCRGVMGSGVAKQVAGLFPATYLAYAQKCIWYRESAVPSALLGRSYIRLEHYKGRPVFVANLFAQLNYGRSGRYTDYEAFRKAMQETASQIPSLFLKKGIEGEPKIAIPYNIGCGLGGGDWSVIFRIIEEELSAFEVTLYELPKR